MRRKTVKRLRRSRRRTYRRKHRGGSLGWSPIGPDTQQRDIPSAALDVSTPRNSTDIMGSLIEKY